MDSLSSGPVAGLRLRIGVRSERRAFVAARGGRRAHPEYVEAPALPRAIRTPPRPKRITVGGPDAPHRAARVHHGSRSLPERIAVRRHRLVMLDGAFT